MNFGEKKSKAFATVLLSPLHNLPWAVMMYSIVCSSHHDALAIPRNSLKNGLSRSEFNLHKNILCSTVET